MMQFNFERVTLYCKKYIKSELVYLLFIELFILQDSIQQLQNNLKEIIIIIAISIMNSLLTIMLKHRYNHKNLKHIIINQAITSVTFSLIICLIIYSLQNQQIIVLYAIIGKLYFSQKMKIPKNSYGQKKNLVKIVFKFLYSCIIGSISIINKNLNEFFIVIGVLTLEMLLNTLSFCIFSAIFYKNNEQMSRHVTLCISPERISYQDSQIQFDTSFLLEILNNSDEGILLLNEDQEIIFCSNSIYRILKTQNPSLIIKLLMNLQNCSNDQNYQNIGIEKLSQQIYFKRPQEKKEKINSVSTAVQLIYQKYQLLILKLNDDIFDYDLDHLNMELTCNQIIQNSQVIKDESNETLYKISLRPYIYNKQLFIQLKIQDITHFNKIRVLKIIDENKSQMMEFVSHEFRTPLNCIILLIQSLINQSETFVIETFLDPILTSAESLLSLIQDMLDLAQMRACKFTLFYESFDLIQLMENIKTLLMPSLKAKQNKLVILQNENQKIITSDMNRIRQILINLIGNASKFTTKGIITIGYKNLSSEYIEIFVQDTGIGISALDQRKLFKAFGKLEDGKQLNQKGVGLGLMISNIIAKRLSKGNMEIETPGLNVESDGSDQGSRFFFKVFCKQIRKSVLTVLLQTNEVSNYDRMNNNKTNQIQTINQSIKPKVKIQEQQKHKSSIEQNNIEIQQQCTNIQQQQSCNCFDTLIVDDEPFNILALKQFLRNMNLKIDSTTYPIEAIQKVKNYECPHKIKENYKIIFMDIEMPQMDGIQTSIEILKLYPQMLIVGISGHSGQKIQDQIREAGMKFLLTKPPNINKIKEILKFSKLYDEI